jgi:uncharacterized coiled-coil protein SlyX
MSKTPICDRWEYDSYSGGLVVPLNVAKDLEIELAEARAEIERLNAPVLSAPLLRETLAELAHNQWVGWMEYLFSKSKQVDCCVVIPAWANERWHRQVATRYADLSEEEKDSDRSEADKFLAVFNAQLAERDKLIEQMKSEIERLKRCCNCEYANHKLYICEHPDNEPETFMDGVCDLWSHNI